MQFGFGIQTGIKKRREALAAAARVVVQEGAGTPGLRAALEEWLPVRDNGALVPIAAKAVQVGVPSLGGGVGWFACAWGGVHGWGWVVERVAGAGGMG